MTTSGLASPLPAVRPREVRDEPASRPSRFRFQSPEKPTFLRVHRRALALSVGLHLLFLLVLPYLPVIDVPLGGSTASAPAGEGGGQVGYLDIALVPPSEIIPLSEITAAQQAVSQGAVQVGEGAVSTVGPSISTFPGGGGATGALGASAGAAGAAGSAAGGAGATGSGGDGASTGAATILRPGYRDPRLYLEPPLLPDLEKSAQQRYAEHLSARLGAVQDSMAAEEARARTTSDWVHTDGSGNRWGLSSEGLHLGGITIPRQLIPSPRSTGDNQTQQDARERQRQRDEIQRQEQDRARRTVQDERARSIRDAENARRGSDGN